jgi:outer membrane protein assembly factor BamA
MTYWYRILAGVLLSAAVCPPDGARASAAEPLKTGEIKIYGNHKIKTYVIRRAIELRTGEPFDQAKVEEARRNIRRIPGVDYSEIRVTYSFADSALSLGVVVTEKSAFRGDPIIQRGMQNQFSYGLALSEHNFRGRSELLSASAMFYGGTVARARWENPWIGQGPRVGAGVSAEYMNYEYVYDDLAGAYEGARIERFGGELTIFYTFRSGFRLLASAGYAAAESDREGVTNDPGGDRYPSVTLGLDYDRRGSSLWPWSGWYLRADATAVGPGQDAFSIRRSRLDARLYLPVFNRTVLAAQIRPRINDGDRIPVYMREHIGGGRTVRSYDYGEFNADNSMVAGAEYRIPINFNRRHSVEDKLLAVSLHVFADAGVAWEQDQSPDDGDLWHGGYGVGVLLLNAWFRGLRFDYGWHRGSSGMFHFEIGPRF